MYVSAPQKRIIGAVVAATVIVSGALFLREKNPALNEATVVNGEKIVVGTAPKRTAIPVADSNNDGVADWQEALQKTDTIAVAAASSSFIAPRTLTDQFALNFFEQMVRSKNYGDFGAKPAEIASSASAELAKKATDEPITASSILISNDNSSQALAQYGEAIARIIVSHNDDSNENEAVILERALRDQSEAELQKLKPKAAVYTALLKETLTLPVPNTATVEHLALVNSYQAILSDITAMSNAFDDPMLALLRIKRYQDDAAGLTISIAALYDKLLKSNATWPNNSVVYQVIKITE